MAVDYTTLFTRLGRIVKWVNLFEVLQNEAGASSVLFGADDILDEYDARRHLVTGLYDTMRGWSSSVAGWSGQLVAVATRTLLDLQQELNAPRASLDAVLPLLVQDMLAEAETVDASTAAVTSVTADAANSGNGVLVASITNVDGLTDERAIAETVEVTCSADSHAGGTAAAAEAFDFVGYPEQPVASFRTRGNGAAAAALVAAGGGNVVTNGTFNAFTANVPDGWTLVAGTAGTHVKSEASIVHTAATTSLRFDGDGAQATVTVTQAIATVVRPRTRYCLGVWARKGVGAVNAGSNLQISVKGTGFTTANAFNADPTGLGTDFAATAACKTVFFNVGETVPADLKVEITWTTANAAAATADLYFDDLAVVPTVTFGHVHYAAFGGSTPFVIGDKFTVVTANNYAGAFQAFFGRYYDVLLPSDAGGGETIDDALAA